MKIRLTGWRRWAGLALMVAVAAPAASTNSDWFTRVWQTGDGLPNNNVTGLAQTPDGYLWVATTARMVRFDGVHFEELFSDLAASGYSQKVSAVLSTHDRCLWLGMAHGRVIQLNSGTTRVFTNGLPDWNAETLTEDAAGAIWVTFQRANGPVFRIENGQITDFTTNAGLPVWSVCSLARDTKGVLWFAKGGEVGVFRDGKFHSLMRVGQPSSITRLATARAGGIWICSGPQLFKYDEGGQLQSMGSLELESPALEPTVVLEDHQGGLWIGTSDSGLFHYNHSGFEPVPTSHRQIWSLIEDRENNLWVGTGGGGLDRIRPRAVALENAETGLPFETVQSLCEDAKGGLWAATQNGLLVCRTTNGWSTISTNITWPGGRPTCVTVDRDGALWIGTKDFALHCWQDGHFITWRQADGVLSHNIHTVLASRTGDVWIGGNAPDSLQRLHAGKLLTIPVPPGMHTIRTMAEDAAGNIWMGTINGMLLRVHGDQLTDETATTSSDETGPAANTPRSIRCLHATPDGSLWIGYAASGVGQLKDGHFARITTKQGLNDDCISQIVADERGWLWFGADHGIFKVRQQELENVTTGRAARVKSIYYGQGEGLPSLQANFGNSPGAICSRDGRLWIPMSTALVMVDPGQLREDSMPPPVRLKRVTVDDRTVARYGGVMPLRGLVDLQDPHASLRLDPAHHRLQFEFAALNLAAPENAQFRYRMDGFDNEWIEAGTERSAEYSRLPAGNYRFRVSACNSAGDWNEEAAAIGFSVAPFFWQTWWFRLAAVAVFTGSTIGIVRYVSFRRLRLKLQTLEQQAALDRERARIAKDLHDDLGGSLTQVTLLLELTRRDRAAPDKVDEHVQQGLASARQVIKSLDETVWAVNPRNDTLPHLINYIAEFAFEFLQKAGIRCQVDLPDHPPRRIVSAEMRHNLFLVVKEALNNVVRHAGADEVRLRATVTGESLGMVIEDNGQGFAGTPDNADADGLRNMRQRIGEIGGQFQIESVPGARTQISLTVPWRSGNKNLPVQSTFRQDPRPVN